MTRLARFALPVAALLVAGSAWAGGKDCADKAAAAKNVAHSKCTASSEECKRMMAESRTHGWIGLKLDKDDAGTLTVTSVHSGSPAEKAGFQAGDVLVAMNGITIEEANHDALKAAKSKLHVGDAITYTVRRSGAEQKLSAKLAPMPDEVYTAMVDEHMKEHATVASR